MPHTFTWLITYYTVPSTMWCKWKLYLRSCVSVVMTISWYAESLPLDKLKPVDNKIPKTYGWNMTKPCLITAGFMPTMIWFDPLHTCEVPAPVLHICWTRRGKEEHSTIPLMMVLWYQVERKLYNNITPIDASHFHKLDGLRSAWNLKLVFQGTNKQPITSHKLA